MGEHAEVLDHVEHPDEVGVLLFRMFFVGEGTVVLVIVKAVRVGADQFGAVADVVDAIAVDGG